MSTIGSAMTSTQKKVTAQCQLHNHQSKQANDGQQTEPDANANVSAGALFLCWVSCLVFTASKATHTVAQFVLMQKQC